MKTFAVTVGLVLGAAAAAPFAHAAPLSDVPVGHWAAQSVHRLAAKKIITGGQGGKFRGDKPVTRYELAVTLDRLVRYMEAGRKPLSTGSVKPSAVNLPASADAFTQRALARLTQGGFVSAASPLLQANKVVTARELTDVLSQLTIRLSDRSLLPTPH